MTPDNILQQSRHLLREDSVHKALALLAANENLEACRVRLREWQLAEQRTEEAARHCSELAPGDTAESAVSRSILAFLHGDLERALQECETALKLDNDNASAHNHAGRALHNAGRSGDALAAFQRAVRIDPEYPEAWHNLGHARRANGDNEGALAAYGNALKLAPGFLTARHNLGATLFNLDQPAQAHDHFSQVLEKDPDHVGALVDGGLTLQLMGQFSEAESHFRRAIELEPGNAVAHLYLGRLRNELMDTPGALEALQASLQLDPDDVEGWVELTGVYEQSNQLDDAIQALGKGFTVDPKHPGLHLEGARIERRRKNPEAAVRRLRSLNPAQLPGRLAQQYWFELGHCLDQAMEPDSAVQAFITANQLARQGIRSRQVDPGAFEHRCVALENWLDADAPGMLAGPDEPPAGKDLCFLVGFPRSGTTLVDTTLETSGRISALEEAATLDVIVAELQRKRGGYPGAISGWTANDVEAGRRAYQAAAEHWLNDDWPELLLDKMPLRFLHAGLIKRLFPDARTVFVLRHPCDVVLSNFMQQFAVNETNIHFDTLANAARMYDRIMGLWSRIESVVKPDVHYVRYEDLVLNGESAIKSVCHYLDVDPASVTLDRDARLATRDRVRTSSYQQVAEPIYQRAAGRWHRYRPHLEPLMPTLAPWLTRFGYDE